MNPLSSVGESVRHSEISVQDSWTQYRYWTQVAMRGDCQQAAEGMAKLFTIISDDSLRARIYNDLGVVASLNGQVDEAKRQFTSALSLAPEWSVPRENLRWLPQLSVVKSEVNSPVASRTTRVAIVSLLFNWPSTDREMVHTVELGKFLTQAGYLVRHFYADFPEWGLGNATGTPMAFSEAIRFTPKEWTVANVQARIRTAIQEFAPDWVIVTDSWNSKPILAEAVQDHRYFMRIATMECLCPLNNIRLLFDGEHSRNCAKHQLASPKACFDCVSTNGMSSGGLHKTERDFVGYGSAEYDLALRTTLANAEAVLVVNPLIEAMVAPYANKVRVIPNGVDSARFSQDNVSTSNGTCLKLLFAGSVNEPMTGFQVLYQACTHLWKTRCDFELVATADPPGSFDQFTRFVGRQTSSSLLQVIHDADILVVPTEAEESVTQAAVEAMGLGRPVIASRIGGLRFTVADGTTGLLFEPGDSNDLARQLGLLLDNRELRQQMGQAGRKRFEEYFTWETIIRRHYLPLLGPPTRRSEVVDSDSTRADHTLASGKNVQALSPQCSKPNVFLGCVLGIRNRPAIILERTFQTFAFQSRAVADRVLLDYGSTPELNAEYQALCRRYDWRLVSAVPPTSEWSLSRAYNIAVNSLVPEVNVVFKGDVDVLIGENVLETAARIGRDHLCIFSCHATSEGVIYPNHIPNGQVLREWFHRSSGMVAMDGEGIHAYPRRWFEEIGGFDLQYGAAWGFEDSDLRLRACWSIGVSRPTEHLLIHQWHPRALPGEATRLNYQYYQSTINRHEIVRNGGQSVPTDVTITTEPVDRSRRQLSNSAGTLERTRIRVSIATRSLAPDLYNLSGEFLEHEVTTNDGIYVFERHRIVGTDACGYFGELLKLDTDWVVNIDEDAFLLDPQELVETIRFMDRGGFAACGMPDGGVVSIRHHNPVACNAFFNVLDMRRVRLAWNDRNMAKQSPFRRAYEALVPAFARQTPAAFDAFEPYYGLFFSLLERQECILYLPATEWSDAISTLLFAPTGAPLMLHAWYAREWLFDQRTRGRFLQLADDARRYRKRRSKVLQEQSNYYQELLSIAGEIHRGVFQ